MYKVRCFETGDNVEDFETLAEAIIFINEIATEDKDMAVASGSDKLELADYTSFYEIFDSTSHEIIYCRDFDSDEVSKTIKALKDSKKIEHDFI